MVRRIRTPAPMPGNSPRGPLPMLWPRSTDIDTHSEGSPVEPGRLFDQLATAEDSQTASATDAPRNRTVATYRA
jgi:hypothetical protein